MSIQNPSIDISGKVALVTGANRGIGKAIVEAFVEAGAKKVYAAVRALESAAPLVNDLGPVVVPLELDITKPEQCKTAAKIGADVQVLVNNAGVLRVASPFAPDLEEQFRVELETNVFGMLRLARAFQSVLKMNEGGAFVQLNSVASLQNFPAFSSYCASKAAAYSFTQALAAEFALQGTAVLSVHPGPIETDMAAEAGMAGMGEPPSVVADGILQSLRAGAFHLFPDTFAKSMGEAYQGFASEVVEAGIGGAE